MFKRKQYSSTEYYRGCYGCKFGIYNTATKKYVFGISEDTPMLAEARLFEKIGNDARKRRFEPRKLNSYENRGAEILGLQDLREKLEEVSKCLGKNNRA